MSECSLALVLAAGEGTRMRSALPKVLHPVMGRPLLGHVLQATTGLNAAAVAVVTGAGREQVEAWLQAEHTEVLAVEQAERRGTGHAVKVALAALAERGLTATGDIAVLTGDTPLLTGQTLADLLAHHRETQAAATVLTAELPDPTGYGRVLRGSDSEVTGIVEHRDATAEELAVREINSGIYVFRADLLLNALAKVQSNNNQAEEYLTDVLGLLHADGHRVSAYIARDPNEVLGVNDRAQLADAAALLRQRINRAWMLAGVSIEDPDTTWIESEVVIAPDALIAPGCFLRGRTAIAARAVVGPETSLTDCVIGEAAVVLRSHAVGALIGAGAEVGPFSYLRPGAELQERAKAGAYVEIKNSVIGPDSKVPHLSYVGDAEVGAGTNIGAATVVVNYDGVHKHRTVIGDAVRIGSDTMLVAPVTVGDGAYTAAGSVITEDVPAGALGIGRSRQQNIAGWVQKNRAGSTSALAANNQETETE